MKKASSSQSISNSLSELKKQNAILEPLLGLIMAAPKAIPFDILFEVLNTNKRELLRRLKILQEMSIISKTGTHKTPHFSMNDDYRPRLSSTKRGEMNIDVKIPHNQLAEYCWKKYLDVLPLKDIYRPYFILDSYIIYSLPHHLKNSGKTEEFNRLRNDIAYWITRYWFFDRGSEKDFCPIDTPWSKKHSSYLEAWDRDYFFCLMSFSSASDTVDFSMNEIVEKLSLTEFYFKSSKPWDDDCYWMARSPFDNKYYVFAGMSAPYYRPFYILNEPPADWNE
ncbi:MAG: hypothetical protein HUU54_05595 [Ignavibacteriaceae bacterium]|nr:hypothetical protein [Ignavibacteriaceae bacterium]